MPGRSDPTLEEIRQYVVDSLNRSGVPGQVQIGPAEVILFGAGAPVSVNVGQLPEQWAQLSAEQRRRRAHELALKLARKRRADGTPSRSTKRRLPQWITPLLILLAAGGLIYAVIRVYSSWAAADEHERSRGERSRSTEALLSREAERATRARRVCATTRSRVMRGATVGPSDVEGWVVELTALSKQSARPLTLHPALRQFAAPVAGEHRSRFAWPGAPKLMELEGPSTELLVFPAAIGAAESTPWSGVRLVLAGRYVVPYFDEKARREFFAVSAAFGRALDADYAALYARCENERTHYVGSWFSGAGPDGAAAALIYFMGTFARSAHVDPGGLGDAEPMDRAAVLDRIAKAAADIDEKRLSALLAPHGGMVAGGKEKTTIITFPFRDANRASRASRHIARQIGIGVDR